MFIEMLLTYLESIVTHIFTVSNRNVPLPCYETRKKAIATLREGFLRQTIAGFSHVQRSCRSRPASTCSALNGHSHSHLCLVEDTRWPIVTIPNTRYPTTLPVRLSSLSLSVRFSSR